MPKRTTVDEGDEAEPVLAPAAPAPPKLIFGPPRHTGSIGGLGFRRIPTVLGASEILDKAFLRASKISVPGQDAFERTRRSELGRLRSAQNTIDSVLAKYVRTFPSFEQLPPFYRDLAKVLLDVDRVRKALGAIDWARDQIVRVGDEASKRLSRSRTGEAVREEKRKAYGRISSLVNQVDKDLKVLNEARNVLRNLPYIDVGAPAVVIAGYPNVGKSSFLRRVSHAEPEVAPYPFTTKGIGIGHATIRRVKYQVIDTPGLLDRPLEERNAIEVQAILALKHLADAVVFLLDPSERCGYPMEAQENLLVEVRRLFPDAPFVVAENKVDVAEGRFTGRKDRFRTSTETGEGVAELLDAAIGLAAEHRAAAPEA